MLIRPGGYNDGGKEYLEEGKKNGREYTREELDERIILHGDLDLTQMVYQQIPDKGQERYASFVLSFREDEIPNETILSVTQEFRQFLMHAYIDDEYNFYAEAHLPKIKEVVDKKTGATVVRKPHVHIFIPRKNLLSGNEMNPRGMYEPNIKSFEAFQEYINQKYSLESPREHVRVNPSSAADVLSRYKGDDFRSKNQDFKRQLVTDVIEKQICTRVDFYQHVSSFGTTRIRNKGKDDEYIAVKLPGDAKFTNLKETIFQDDFIVRRELKKEPLAKHVIQERLTNWPQRAKEIKYVSKATPKFRQLYKAASSEEKIHLLAQRQTDFYEKYRGLYDLHPVERERDHQRSIAEAETGGTSRATNGLQGLSRRDVAVDRNSREAMRAVLLPGDAHLRLGQEEPGRGAGLRPDLPAPGGRRRKSGEYDFDKFTAIPAVPTVADVARRAGYRIRGGVGGGRAEELNIPPYAFNPHRIAGTDDIERRGERLFGQLESVTSAKSTRVGSVRRVMPKPAKTASFVAACFLRQHEQNQILPEHRWEIYAVNQQFFAARRTIQTDDRLTRKEKAQYVSVLTFERLKAHHAIRQPYIPFEPESTEMGSDDIRKMIKEPRIPENSISGAPPEDKDIPPARARFSRIIQNINEHMDEKRMRDRQRAISVGDLYTKRARLSKNVHYLDKKTDRTMFVDTGKAIAVRKSGMTESAVAVALELAKEKFGSTLTIKGSQAFKDQVIDVVARKNMDVHFTDKAMNKQLEERKAELAIEREGQRIEQPETAEAVQKTTDVKETDNTQDNVRSGVTEPVGTEHMADPSQKPVSPAEPAGKTKGRDKVHYGVLLEHGAAPYQFKPNMKKPEDERADNYYVKLDTGNGKVRTLWGVGLQDAVQGLRPGDHTRFEDKGTERVSWTETLKDGSMVEKSGDRRTWHAEPTDWSRQQERRAELLGADADGPGVD